MYSSTVWYHWQALYGNSRINDGRERKWHRMSHVNDESIAHYRRWQGQASIANREKKCDLRYRITVLGRVPVTVLLLGH